MPKRKTNRPAKSDPFYAHEALDRTHLVSVLFNDFLVEHPFIQADPALRRAADAIASRLGDLYQAVGNRLPD